MSEFTTDIAVRYRDLDPLDHVNHAVYASYLEAARTDYLETVLEVAPEEINFVIANLEIDYRRPIVKGDDPEIALWVSGMGDSSCTMAYEIRVGDEIAATAETTMVHVDADAKQPTPMPDETREALETADGVEASA
ncbi:acyl-CoA thioesterase [Halobiforma nitratireducens]|uniref:Thioesterase superfamily protein n=1 Tax=Halobiforma nitratireducens JCM 10879 TaxID=1227454 RepID=M0LXM0_9EURY|nr:thioesterase family protein [Halobiforma nitratireducens]EMA36850.1 thioesterase superfamily protein [Halobiforma nitratireducens JCM 10879]